LSALGIKLAYHHKPGRAFDGIYTDEQIRERIDEIAVQEKALRLVSD